jgi:hypothetical protein
MCGETGSSHLLSAETPPPFAPLHIISDSKYIIESFTKKITEWEECGCINIPNKEFIKPIVSHLRAQGAITTLKKETGQIGSKNAKVLANTGVHKEQCDALDLNPNQNFNLTGAQLSLVSQATAYRGLREREQVAPRLFTTINLNITRHAVNDLTGHMPTDAQMWHSIRSKNITRTIRVFLWKVLYKTQKCGDYWLNIPTSEHCFECGVEDSITHILTECSAPGQSEIWNLTKKVWLKKHDSWPTIKGLGLIVGCCMAKFYNQKGQRKLGTEQLYQILMTESAHLIWRIRM